MSNNYDSGVFLRNGVHLDTDTDTDTDGIVMIQETVDQWQTENVQRLWSETFNPDDKDSGI